MKIGAPAMEPMRLSRKTDGWVADDAPTRGFELVVADDEGVEGPTGARGAGSEERLEWFGERRSGNQGVVLSVGPRREGGETLSCGGIRRGGVRSGRSLSLARGSGATFVVGIGIAELVSLVRGSVFRVGIVDMFSDDAVCIHLSLGVSALCVGFGERALARSTYRSSSAHVSLSPHG
jgi:hypothetical protein